MTSPGWKFRLWIKVLNLTAVLISFCLETNSVDSVRLKPEGRLIAPSALPAARFCCGAAPEPEAGGEPGDPDSIWQPHSLQYFGRPASSA